MGQSISRCEAVAAPEVSETIGDESGHGNSTQQEEKAETFVETAMEAVKEIIEQEPKQREIVLQTAPLDHRFTTPNAARYCYTVYNEYHRCLQQTGDNAEECQKYYKTFRSLCPDEWLEKWNELRENGQWYGKY